MVDLPSYKHGESSTRPWNAFHHHIQTAKVRWKRHHSGGLNKGRAKHRGLSHAKPVIHCLDM